ncbi:pilus assembly protein TadG-related protein [Streptomyces sp. NPDC056835]|uniref:pilus assembly protein TadG-related protein n=1 Tax=Streptomyces sp. NPDC056835 TaxID=3345956 RepID=UPI00367CA3D7
MTRSTSSESGQAAPIYITMVAGLLFLALAFFAVGQAGATRNEAQGAADAAALAAAQESRDLFRDGLLAGLLDPEFLDDVFNGDPIGTEGGCQAATRFADQNGADVLPGECRQLDDGRWGFRVRVRTQEPMGPNILSETEDKHAEAVATAVVVPRCSFEPAEEEQQPEDGEESEDSDDAKPASPGTLDCGGSTPWDIDPEHLDLLPDMADLFSVRLAQD